MGGAKKLAMVSERKVRKDVISKRCIYIGIWGYNQMLVYSAVRRAVAMPTGKC